MRMVSILLNDICSVVVTYNYGQEFRKNISRIYEQSFVIWIDNSIEDDSHDLKGIILSECPDIIYKKNFENIGLPKCYNIALEIAKTEGAKYFATFDQDTLIESDTLTKLVKLIGKYHIDSIGPNYDHSNRTNEEVSRVNFLISSCNVTKISVFESIKYNERFFIDDVDLEFCLAMKKNNLNFLKANSISVSHQIGEKYRSRFGICFYAHAPERYYYIFRNYYFLKKLYRDPYIIKLKIRLTAIKFLIFLFFRAEDKKRALYFIKKGIIEGKQS